MKTQTLVQDSAQIVRVVTLAEGDIYKRVDNKSTYSEAKLSFGVVTSIMNNGESVAVTALEVQFDGYNSASVRNRVFTADEDLQLFPATRGELLAHREDVMRAMRRAKESAESSLEEAIRRFEHAETVFGHMAAALDAPQVLEVEA